MAVMTSETGGSGGCGESTVASSTRRRTLSSSRWFTTDEAGRMLHVTDALLSLGTLQVASRSVPTRKSRGPRFKREHALSLSLSPSNRGIWRTRRGGEQAKGVCKSQWKCRRIFHLSPPFPRNSVRARFTFFQRPLFLRGEISNRSCSRRIKN